MKLPPLNSLRAFEAAARAGGYVAAAEELSVSPAAVSQHVKKLEAFFGKQLFMRLNNRVVLTDAGTAIFADITVALHSISDMTETVISGRSSSRLVVSTISSVAERWLEPVLAGFAHANQKIRFDLRVEPDPVDFARDNIDLRVSYGAGLYSDKTIVHLVRDKVLPVCGPEYLAQNPAVKAAGVEAVPEADLIHTSWGPAYGSNPTWHTWFVNAGLSPPNDSKGFQIGRSSLALDMARDGVGVALGQRLLAEGDLAAGRLIELSDHSIALGHPYCLVYPANKSRKHGLLALVDWLVGCVGRDLNT